MKIESNSWKLKLEVWMSHRKILNQASTLSCKIYKMLLRRNKMHLENYKVRIKYLKTNLKIMIRECKSTISKSKI